MVRVAAPHDVEGIKRRLCDDVNSRRGELLALSRGIHARPETAFEEWWASAEVARVLDRGGLRVERGVHGMPTAVRATAGPRGGRTAVICCEYDALPGLGHACGHNVIAAAGVGAGLALAPLARRLRQHLTVLGTPAEESGGGKVLLARRGAFRDALIAILVHPSTEDVVTPALRAAVMLQVTFLGRAAHAALAPECGRNALDAAVLGYTAVGAMRASLRSGEQLHGIILSSGPPNVVPACAGARFVVRAPGSDAADALAERVAQACRHAASAVGCRASVRSVGPTYAELTPNRAVAHAFERNAARLGRQMRRGTASDVDHGGSTDLGNVSHLVPTIHPMLAIAPAASPPHTPDFARFAVGPAADRAVLDGAKAMAMTVADLWLRPALRRAAIEQEEP